MLNNILNKNVRVGVAFCGISSTQEASIVKYYEGVIVNFDSDFVMFDDGSMIGIKYILTIQVI